MEDKNTMRFFSSFEEAAEYEREQARLLSPIEHLQNMRKMIDLAYSLSTGKMPEPPTQHTFTLLPTPDWMKE